MAEPLIKGVFVSSHVKALEAAKGPEGLAQLEKLYGKPLKFTSMQDVPVREEVKLIECTLAIMHPEMPEAERPFEAGRLHFTNFRSTPLGRIVFGAAPKDYKGMMMGSKYLAEHVFKNVEFEPTDLGDKKVKILMNNADYPADHFRGLLQEWMNFFKLTGNVSVKVLAPTTYEYLLEWQ